MCGDLKNEFSDDSSQSSGTRFLLASLRVKFVHYVIHISEILILCSSAYPIILDHIRIGYYYLVSYFDSYISIESILYICEIHNLDL